MPRALLRRAVVGLRGALVIGVPPAFLLLQVPDDRPVIDLPMEVP